MKYNDDYDVSSLKMQVYFVKGVSVLIHRGTSQVNSFKSVVRTREQICIQPAVNTVTVKRIYPDATKPQQLKALLNKTLKTSKHPRLKIFANRQHSSHKLKT